VAGEIGSVNKMEYTVLGDTVNTASRLESGVARPGSVVVGVETRNGVDDEAEFEFESLGTFSLKGKEKEVLVYEVRSVGHEDPDTIPRGEETPGEGSGS
jgi:adenylate cyclase